MIPWSALLLATLLLVGFLAYLGFRLHSLFGISAALVATSQTYQRMLPNPTLTILVLGDSTAVGTGGTPETSVAGRLGDKFPTASVYNFGINGEKLSDFDVQMNTLNIQKADVVVLQIGANDIVHFTPISEIEAKLKDVLAKAKKISGNVVVLHSGSVGDAPLLWPLGFIWNIRTQAVRHIYLRDVPAAGAIYVDLVASETDVTFANNPKKYYAPDMFHPSSDGYGLWFDEVVKVLPKTM